MKDFLKEQKRCAGIGAVVLFREVCASSDAFRSLTVLRGKRNVGGGVLAGCFWAVGEIDVARF